jgi:hypothetical protein
MDHTSEIPQTLSRILYLLGVCNHYRDVEGCSELLDGVHDTLRGTLRHVEGFLQHCSESFSMRYDSARHTPEDGTLDIAGDDAMDATLTIPPSDVAATDQDLPPLAPNYVFDNPDAASDLLPVNISPISRYFDFSKFDCDVRIQQEISFGPASQVQHRVDTDAGLNGVGNLPENRGIAQTARADDNRAEPRDATLGNVDRALNLPSATETCTSVTGPGCATVDAVRRRDGNPGIRASG